MVWKLIEGFRWPYRVNDQGVVQKQLPGGEWRTLKPYPYSGQLRVQMWLSDGTWKRVQVSKLVADAFMGGTPPGMLRVHKNGLKRDNAVEWWHSADIGDRSLVEALEEYRGRNTETGAKE